MKRQELRREIEYFHLRLFGTEVSPEVREQYVAAHDFLLFNNSSVRDVKISFILDRKLDVEAVEFFVRLKFGSKNLLTQKFQIMFYLLEIRPEYYDRFVHEDDAFIKSIASLLHSSFRSAAKLLKGFIEVRRYDVV